MAWVSSGCGLISTKVPCSAPAAATAWLNRTGLRRLATQYSASKAVPPPRCRHGGADDRDPRRLRGQVGKRRPQLGQYRINGRMVRGHVHLDAPRQPVLGVHHRDHRIDLLGRPGDHGLARRGIHRQGHFGVVGDQRLGGLPGPAPAAPSRPARPAGPSAATGWRSPATPRPGSAPRPPPPRSPHPSNARSPHPGAPHRSATARSTPTAPPPAPAGSGRCPPPAHRQPAPAAAKTRPAQQTPAPTRPPPRRTPAHRPTTAGPSPPTANPDPNTRTPCPAGTTPHADPPPPAPDTPRPAPATRPPPARDPAHTPWRTWRAGPGDDSACAPPRPTPPPRPVALHPVGQHPRRRRHPLSRLTRHHQRASPPAPVAPATGSGAGPCSNTTCALVPLKPNDDTPARRGPVHRGHQCASATTFESQTHQTGCADWDSREMQVGGICPRCTASTALMKPATPAAASRWPRFDLTAPISSGASPRPSRPSTVPSASHFDRIAQHRAGAVRLDVVDVVAAPHRHCA